MNFVRMAALACVGALSAFPAMAAQMYSVSLDSVGSETVSFTARFSDEFVVDWGDTGYQVAGATVVGGVGAGGSLPRSGGDFWRIDVGQYTYGVVPETDETIPFYRYENHETGEEKLLFGPTLVFKDGKVVAFVAQADIYNFETPVLRMWGTCCSGSEGRYFDGSGYTEASDFSPLVLGGGFEIRDFWLAGGPDWVPPGPIPSTSGIWDYTNSTVVVTSVPEPAAWALMILGFGAVGGTVRRRQRAVAA